jgi:predicted phage tail protein
MATVTNTEAPNTLLSNQSMSVVDLICEGPISGFAYKSIPFTGDALMATYYDDTPVRNIDGSYNYNVSGAGFTFAYMLGNSTQTGIQGFQKVECAIPLGSNTLISNPLPGAGPYKTVVATFNTDMFPDADSVRVTVRVPALFSQDEQGNTNGYVVQYSIDVSVNENPFVTYVNDEINGKCTTPYLRDHTITLPKTAPASTYYSWKVRVRRVSTDIQSIRTQNALFVDSMSVISSSLFAYPNSVIVGTNISANQFSNIPSRAYEIMGMLVNVPNGYTPTRYGNNVPLTFTRQCDVDSTTKHIGMTTQDVSQLAGITAGTAVAGAGIPAGTSVVSINDGSVVGGGYFFTVDKDPTATNNNTTLTFTSQSITGNVIPAVYPTVWTGDFQAGVWTDNPAWIFYDILTDPVHGLGDYINSGSVDKWTLYQIGQYCDQLVDDGKGGLEPRFTCNVSIQQPEDAYNVLLSLASTFRGMLYYANGTIHPVTTNDMSVPVYAFTNANVVDGVFNYSDTARNTRSTVAMVKWIDPNNGYRENVEYVEDIDGIIRYGYVQKDMSAFACTSKGQAYRLGSWTLETERLLTETVTFQTDMEGLYLRPGDVFAVYDNFRNNRSQAGRIIYRQTGGSVVQLDRPVTLEAGLTYSLTCIVPEYVLDGSGSLTGSDQISQIRNPQIQSFRVTNSAGTSDTMIVAGQFSSGLYVGSPWILSSSGDPTGIFRKASFYTCLATSEPEPGKIEVLGLQASTGITFVISTGYTVIDQPPNNGDVSSILPPSNLVSTYVTGALEDGAFFETIGLTWTESPSTNVAYYRISGQTPGFVYSGYNTTSPSFVFPVNPVGAYNFKVAAVSEGGIYSTFISDTETVAPTNPFGTSPPLRELVISEDYDSYLFNSDGNYTGYIGTTPTLTWDFQLDNEDQHVPSFDLVAGYRIRISGLDGTSDYLSPVITLDGNTNTTYEFPDRFLYTGLGGYARRGFDFWVDTLDVYGSYATGARLKMNNPPPKPPVSSGFVGYNGGIYYDVVPFPSNDISGIYIWWNNSSSFTPVFGNHNYESDNMAGLVSNGIYQTGSNHYYMWFALTDNFGYTGCPIYGPIPVDSNGSVSGAYFNLQQSVQQVQATTTGASGSLVAYTNAQVSTVMTALTSTGVALGQRVDVVSANLTTTGASLRASVTTVTTALATTGSALAQWMNYLSAVTSGSSASVTILASAMVTGSIGGIGGVAKAVYGFKLEANGRVASMVATTNSSYDIDSATIAFGSASLQSDTFTAGSAGWRIRGNGDSEFNNVVVRGAFTGGAGTAKASIDSRGLNVGNLAGQRAQISSNGGDFNLYAPNTNQVLGARAVNNAGTYAGLITLYTDASVISRVYLDAYNNGLVTVNDGGITLQGSNNSINCDILDIDSTSTFDGTATFNASTAIDCGGNTIKVGGGNGNNAGISYNNGNKISFIWNGSNVKVYVDGSAQGTIPNP